ncbi:MAG: hypothetical protein HZC51_01315 [Nitrospirae bacterium]|nr:hypothetical protein [Nitrospirota bacterium]
MEKVFKAFVIMPFDNEFTKIYTDLIKPALEGAGYIVTRADSPIDQQNILHDIVHGIADSDLVVAELTSQNPNVLYELGLAHGLKRPTVLIAQSMEDVPFDLRTYRVIVYSTRFDEIVELTSKLKEIGTKNKDGVMVFGSPVSDFLQMETPQPISCSESHEDSIAQDQQVSDSDEEFEKGWFDFMAEGENSIMEMTEVTSVIGSEIEQLGNRISQRTNKFASLKNNSKPGASSKAYKFIMGSAQDLEQYSKKVEKVMPTYEKALTDFENSYLGLLSFINKHVNDKDKSLLELKVIMSKLLQGLRTGLPGASQFCKSIDIQPGISMHLNKSAHKAKRATE